MRVVSTAVAIATVGTLPALLVGTLAVQMRASLHFDNARLGVAVALYFAVSAGAGNPSSTPPGYDSDPPDEGRQSATWTL